VSGTDWTVKEWAAVYFVRDPKGRPGRAVDAVTNEYRRACELSGRLAMDGIAFEEALAALGWEIAKTSDGVTRVIGMRSRWDHENGTLDGSDRRVMAPEATGTGHSVKPADRVPKVHSVGAWLRECCRMGRDCSESRARLQDSYWRWCGVHEASPAPLRTWRADMIARGLLFKLRRNTPWVEGVRLLTADERPDER
jgi:hypothetical protein